ncbi:hypothetical protein PENANT_c130G11668 [Penicillium antarcticum]|uniref:Mid2 domain-containing protein n=1 Tax=Penicillium antarcticum TaxID=416450 RepID=A0A1V6PI04_9EURO|nr:hypothetical protein PENANT_c130G11668 [Penicillium antarcticum]
MVQHLQSNSCRKSKEKVSVSAVVQEPIEETLNLDSQTWAVKVGEAVQSDSGPYGVNARGISIRWQEADFTTVPSTIATTMGPRPSEFGSESRPISGLSTRAKAGVGVGIGIGVSLLLSIAYIAYLLWKKTKISSKFADGNSTHIMPGLSAPRSDCHLEGDPGLKTCYEMPEARNLNLNPPQEMSTYRQ